MQQREQVVFSSARGVAEFLVASTLAGGYARRVADTVRIHVNTIVAAREMFWVRVSKGKHYRSSFDFLSKFFEGFCRHYLKAEFKKASG